MQEHPFWSTWFQSLQRWGLVEPTALLLEASGPLSIILAQMTYLSQPFFKGQGNPNQWEAIGHLLENPGEKSSFVNYLRQED
jgi:hypothetical protein